MVNQNLSHIIISRIEKLEKAVFGKVSSNKATPKKIHILSSDLDFSLGERAFVKRYAEGKSGPREFTILLAYLSQGEIGKDVKLRAIEQRWNKMKSLLGKFNRSYSNDAKNHGWVDSKERGTYRLTKEWKNAL